MPYKAFKAEGWPPEILERICKLLDDDNIYYDIRQDPLFYGGHASIWVTDEPSYIAARKIVKHVLKSKGGLPFKERTIRDVLYGLAELLGTLVMILLTWLAMR